MQDIFIYPDVNNLKQYFDYPQEKIDQIKNQGIRIKTDFYSEEFYAKVIEDFKIIAKQYLVLGHLEELIFLIIYYNEQMVNYSDTLWQNYEDDKISKEVAAFLLAFKKNEIDGDIQLAIKDKDGTHSIKNNAVSKWMCNLIAEAVEKGNMPFDVFGEKIFYDFFGMKMDFNNKLEIEKLQQASKIKLKTPKVLQQKIIVKFYEYLKPYLEDNTNLITKDKSALTNIQAEFFFDLFHILGLLSFEDAKPTKAKYMRTIIKNNQ